MTRWATRNDSIATSKAVTARSGLLLVLLVTLFAASQSLGAEHRATHLGEAPACEYCLAASQSASVPAEPMPELIVPLLVVDGDVFDGPAMGQRLSATAPARAPPARG